MRKLKICVICGKAFMTDGYSSCCGLNCSYHYNRLSQTEQVELKQLAESKKREPRTDCKMYMSRTHTCSGLTGLWCEVEDCKFYKQK